MIVVSGGTGFVGSAVVRQLRADGAQVRLLSRGEGVDLGVPQSLRGACEGARTLLSLASYVGPDAQRCRAVNDRGTRALMSEARRAGVHRIIHLSTCAVYGAGPHRGPEVGEVRPAPVSPASRSRLAGESPVLAAGGTVLRAGLVTGAGDRWVVPALVDSFRRLPGSWAGGRGLTSYVDVGDLARLVAALATGPRVLPAGVLHVSHPEPVRNGELMTALARHGVLPHDPAEGGDFDWQECLTGLAQRPGWVSPRQFALLADDMWYRSEAVWQLAGVRPGPGPLRRLADAVPWYRIRGGAHPDAPAGTGALAGAGAGAVPAAAAAAAYGARLVA
ncbi:NAD(P)-dependent oxidoreductase [Streptomyces sp. WAC06614]|uniref:NAD-dependent epimerase/dehydratase family protein n=1 Tax=Streptomyces sp. WAC06614 TaxID=2487416 RepID=UPI000F772A15|nr:NAD-dependent epimerase/dehydratase family protein [Streptomyces sp. WAC06614]RSS83374.1 NAD-dependent epimerase/dehydratase family protein [Streptomyces sp. WAC06614]